MGLKLGVTIWVRWADTQEKKNCKKFFFSAFTPISAQSFQKHSYRNSSSVLEAVNAKQGNKLINIAIIPPIWTTIRMKMQTTLHMENAWKLYRALGNGKEYMLTFQIYNTRHFLRHYTVPATSKGSVVSSVKKGPGAHFPKEITNQLRCKMYYQRSR